MSEIIRNEWLSISASVAGGALTSIKDRRDCEYLWQGDPQHWSGQAPVLFPICGSLRNDQATTVSGNVISVRRHGIVRKEQFQLEYANEQSICYSIRNNDEMLVRYPYPFQLFITYQLHKNSIKVIYRIENKGNEDMPFFIGGHPGFNCPLGNGTDYSDYQVVFEVDEDCSVPVPVTETGLIETSRRVPMLNNNNILPLSHQLFENDAIIFDRLRSRKAAMMHKHENWGIELEFSQFPYLILWSSANCGCFLAMEPWTGLSTCSDEDNIFEHKRNVRTVKPGMADELSYTITIIS